MIGSGKPPRRRRARSDVDRTKGGNLQRFRPWLSEEVARSVDSLAQAQRIPRRELAERAIATVAAAAAIPSARVAAVDRTKGGRFKRFDLWIDRELLMTVDAIARAERISKREVFSRAIRSLANVGTPVTGET